VIRDPSDGSVKRGKRPSVDALKAKYGPDWGINPPPDMPAKPPVKAPSVEELTEFYRNNPERIMRLLGDQGETE
jgi:hypothetical protein